MIKNLLFDLGGVVIDIRRQNCIDAFTAIGMGRVAELLDDYTQRGPALEIENGKITPQQFCQQLRQYTGIDASDDAIQLAFTKFIIGIPTERLQALRRLQANYRTLFLSNTNPIMWNKTILPEFQKEGLSIDDYFTGGGVKSFEAGVVKPEPEIFHILERLTGIRPEETLFYDDSEANCKIAASLGYHTIHVAPNTEFYNYVIPSLQ
jgi:putative hydrolase of the HAD superfamily